MNTMNKLYSQNIIADKIIIPKLIHAEETLDLCYPPSFAVLHVWVGTSFEQCLCDVGHASHNFTTVFLRVERADQVQRRLHCTHCGSIHLRRVTDQKSGRKFIS